MNKVPLTSLTKIVITLLVITLIFYWWQNNKIYIEYETAQVKMGNIESLVGAIGTLSPRYSIDIGAQVSGQVTKLAVTPGIKINKGDLLVEIDASIQQATVDASHAELASLQAKLSSRQAVATLAIQQFKRQKMLFNDKFTSEDAYHLAIANIKSSEANVKELVAQIKQQTSRLKADEARLSYTKIYAPTTGTVLSVSATEGQTLNATYSTPIILNIADLSTMTVKAKVAEADIRYIKPNMTVWFTTLGDDIRRWHSHVRQILPAPPQSDKLAVFYTVLFDVNNADGALMPGMTTKVFFVIDFAENVLIAPLSGLHAVKDKTNIYTARVLESSEAKPKIQEITIGRYDILNAEILNGLKQGSKIVTGEFHNSKLVTDMAL